MYRSFTDRLDLIRGPITLSRTREVDVGSDLIESRRFGMTGPGLLVCSEIVEWTIYLPIVVFVMGPGGDDRVEEDYHNRRLEGHG